MEKLRQTTCDMEYRSLEVYARDRRENGLQPPKIKKPLSYHPSDEKDGIHIKRETSSDIDPLTTDNDEKQALEICRKS